MFKKAEHLGMATTRSIPVEQRFWTKVDKRGPDECWLWTASKDRDGYGAIRASGQMHRAHRIAWKLINGQEPNGCVCHSCDDPACVNPSHLWIGSHQDNMQDMAAKGRCNSSGPIKPNRAPKPVTHCSYGHEYTSENTYALPSGGRACRTCRRNWRNQRRTA